MNWRVLAQNAPPCASGCQRALLVGDFLGGAIGVAGTQSNQLAVKVSRAIL